MQLYKLAFSIVSACTVVYGYKESSYQVTFRPEGGIIAGHLKHLHELLGLNYTIDERALRPGHQKARDINWETHLLLR